MGLLIPWLFAGAFLVQMGWVVMSVWLAVGLAFTAWQAYRFIKPQPSRQIDAKDEQRQVEKDLRFWTDYAKTFRDADPQAAKTAAQMIEALDPDGDWRAKQAKQKVKGVEKRKVMHPQQFIKTVERVIPEHRRVCPGCKDAKVVSDVGGQTCVCQGCGVDLVHEWRFLKPPEKPAKRPKESFWNKPLRDLVEEDRERMREQQRAHRNYTRAMLAHPRGILSPEVRGLMESAEELQRMIRDSVGVPPMQVGHGYPIDKMACGCKECEAELQAAEREIASLHRKEDHIGWGRLTEMDRRCLRALQGASFAPGTKVVLPSGIELTGKQVQLLLRRIG